jgi:hypothetical protein
MRWSNEQRAFAVEAYFSNGGSVVSTQCGFRSRFNIAPLGPVPDRKSILLWVTTFRETGSVQKRGSGDARPIRSPDNIEAVRVSFLRSPRRSALKHASAIGISDRSVRRILHDELHFHPYKLAIVPELSECDFNARRNACEAWCVWSGWHVHPIWPRVTFFCRGIWNPVSIPTAHRLCKTWTETFRKKRPTYPSICWREWWETAEFGSTGVSTMRGVTYPIWFLKRCKPQF